MLSKKYYQMIAKCINNYGMSASNIEKGNFEEVFLKPLCEELLRDNPRFDRKKFLEACNMPEVIT